MTDEELEVLCPEMLYDIGACLNGVAVGVYKNVGGVLVLLAAAWKQERTMGLANASGWEQYDGALPRVKADAVIEIIPEVK